MFRKLSQFIALGAIFVLFAGIFATQSNARAGKRTDD